MVAAEMVRTSELLVMHLGTRANALRVEAAELERLGGIFADRLPTLRAIVDGFETPPEDPPPPPPKPTTKTTAGEALERYKAKERARKAKRGS